MLKYIINLSDSTHCSLFNPVFLKEDLQYGVIRRKRAPSYNLSCFQSKLLSLKRRGKIGFLSCIGINPFLIRVRKIKNRGATRSPSVRFAKEEEGRDFRKIIKKWYYERTPVPLPSLRLTIEVL